jgi:hypothetical protein
MGPQARKAVHDVVPSSSLDIVLPHGTVHGRAQAHFTLVLRHRALFDAVSVSAQFTASR